MQNYVGNVSEFQLTAEGRTAARITCPEKAIPAPGQYLLAYAPGDADAPLATILFPSERSSGSFVAAPPSPPTWQLGTTLHLRGPFGRGFRLPGSIRNLALVALGDTLSRLQPLLTLADNIALFLPTSFPPSNNLPSSIEINPLSDLPAALRWADFLTLDLPVASVPDLPKLLGLTKDQYLPCPAQALIITPMPCGGIADCGVCAVGDAHKYWLTCKDGPVFDVKELITGKQR